MRVVLDTCILKLATFPGENNPSALIFELVRGGLIDAWVSPAILEEYAVVLGDHPDFVAEIVQTCSVYHPLTELGVIRRASRLPSCVGARGLDPRHELPDEPGIYRTVGRASSRAFDAMLDARRFDVMNRDLPSYVARH